MPTLENMEVYLSIAGIAIALITFVRGVYELYQRNLISRVDLYTRMRDIYARDSDVKAVCEALGKLNLDQTGNGDPGVATSHDHAETSSIDGLTYQQKRQFLGTIETIALMTRSGIMDEHLATYMFGYYAISAWHADAFWGEGNLQRDHPMWSLFARFVERAQVIRDEFETNPGEQLHRLSFHTRIGQEITRGTRSV